MSIINDDSTAPRHPAEGDDELTLGRPVWATETEIQDDLNGAVVRHQWFSDTTATGYPGVHPEPMTVSLVQLDNIKVGNKGVCYQRGLPLVYLNRIDASFDSPEDARDYAAAILECCDRWEASRSA